MLDFLGKSRDQSVADLIARRQYGRAIEVLRAALQRRRNDPRLRVQLAEVLVQSGKAENGVAMLAEVADDLVLGGSAAQAIAVLKRIQALDPGRSDIEEKLVYMIAQQKRPSPDPWRRARRAIARSAPPPPVHIVPPPPRAFPGDLEEVDETPADLEPPTPAAEEPLSGTSFSSDGEAAEAVADGNLFAGTSLETGEAAEVDDALRNELLALIEDVFAPGGAERLEVAAGDAAGAPAAVLETPLFEDFTAEELVEMIHGLALRHFDAGEIVVTEGEPGASLFVLTTGRVRAYVKNAAGRNAKVRDLVEGDFFGEVSLLRGVGRTATVTAVTRAELLELDRDTLNAISQRHPRVWGVLKDFYDRRAGSTLETVARESGPEAEG